MAQVTGNLLSSNPMGIALKNKINPYSTFNLSTNSSTPSTAPKTASMNSGVLSYLGGIGKQNQSTDTLNLSGKKTTPTPTTSSPTNQNSVASPIQPKSQATNQGLYPLAPGVTPITNVAEATQAGQAVYNKNNPTTTTPTSTATQVTNPATTTYGAPIIDIQGNPGTATFNPTNGQPLSPTPPNNGTPTYNQPTGNYTNPLINNAINAGNQAVNINQELDQAINDRTKTGIPLPYVQGQQAALQRDYGVQANAATQNATNAAGLVQYGQPQAYGLTTQPYFPLTDTYGGGSTGGAINRASQAGNIGSAQDLTTKINSGQQSLKSGQDNFQLLQSIATQGGIPTNTPIANILSGSVANIIGGDSTIKAFQSQLNAVRSIYSSLLGVDGNSLIPDGVTVGDLTALEQTLDKNATNTIGSYQSQLSRLQEGGTGGNTPSTAFGGSAWQ